MFCIPFFHGAILLHYRFSIGHSVIQQGAVAQIDLCFDKLSMFGKVTRFQHITVRPEPVEGQTVGLGNSPSRQSLLILPCIFRRPQTGVRVTNESMVMHVRLLRREFTSYEKVQQETVFVGLQFQGFLCPFLF
jgi:hypothetical protein